MRCDFMSKMRWDMEKCSLGVEDRIVVCGNLASRDAI